MSKVNLLIMQRSSGMNRIFIFNRWLLILLCGLCLALCGCKNPQIVWSAEYKSPDGKMLVSGKAYANGGFGVSGIPITFIYLNKTTGSQKPQEILEFSNESQTSEGEAVEIKWLSSTQLEVGYHKDKQEVLLQTVKFGDIIISLKNLSSN